MIDQHYIDPELARLYDLDSGWSIDSDFYLELAGRKPIDILDIGCGTGLLACAYASRGHRVTAVDPAKAMLDVARKKPQAHQISWVHSPAETYRSKARFDLIVMTGNAMMALLDFEAITGCFEAIKYHLRPSGRVVFEVRNPDLDWASVWDYDMVLKHGDIDVVETRRFVAMDESLMRFEFDYVFPYKTVTTKSAIRFSSQKEIRARLEAVGLVVVDIRGGWHGEPYEPNASKYMIFTARHSQGGNE